VAAFMRAQVCDSLDAPLQHAFCTSAHLWAHLNICSEMGTRLQRPLCFVQFDVHVQMRVT